MLLSGRVLNLILVFARVLAELLVCTLWLPPSTRS